MSENIENNNLNKEVEEGSGNTERKLNPEEQEKNEAELVALEKLKILTTHGFKEFAIRFENLDSYKKIISKESSGVGNEIFVPSLIDYGYETSAMSDDTLEEYSKIKDMDFNEYLKNKGVGLGGWRTTIHYQTDMPKGSSALYAQKLLLGQLNEERKEVSEEKKNQQELDIRTESLNRFRNTILQYKDKKRERNPSLLIMEDREQPTAWADVVDETKKICEIISELEKEKVPNDILSLAREAVNQIRTGQGMNDGIIKKINDYAKSNIQSEHREVALKFNHLVFSIKELLSLGVKDVETIFSFVENPDYIQKKGSLRKVIQALVKNTRPGNIDQYEIAMIYHTDAVSTEQTFHNAWRKLKEGEEGKSPTEHLLGTIVLNSDKEVINMVNELAVHAEKDSHPVFDDKGRIRYPKAKK